MIATDIIKRCQSRDKRAFKVMYESCLPYVYTVVSDYTSNSDFKKDLIQEIFAKIFMKLNTYDSSKGEFKPWLRRVAVNQCLMFLRDKLKHFKYDDLEGMYEGMTEPTKDNFIELYENKSPVQLLLNKMPNGYRIVFSLVELEGYSHKEVGAQLGISADASRSQLAKAKKWLRTYFKNNNIKLDEK